MSAHSQFAPTTASGSIDRCCHDLSGNFVVILYTCEGSRGLRATWAAAELKLNLQLQMMPFPPRLFQPSYLDRNPLGTVPMLIDNATCLTESTAITQYLAYMAEPNDLAVEPVEADFGPYIDFLHHADATLTFPQTVYLRFAVFERERGLAEAGEAYGRWFTARLAKLELRLQERDFLCAQRFTLADVASGYALWLARQLGLDRGFTPVVTDYLDRLVARPGFKQALAQERAAGIGVTPSFADHLRRLTAPAAGEN